MDHWDKYIVDRVEGIIGYNFIEKKLLEQAFTRESYVIEVDNNAVSYQVLEFIGDRVLDTIVVKMLSNHLGKIEAETLNDKAMEHFGYYVSTFQEGDLSLIKSRLVNKNALAKAMDQLNLKYFILMGLGEKTAKIQETPSAKEDLFEAILGAVAVDSHWNYAVLEKVLLRMYEGLDDFIKKVIDEPLICEKWDEEFPEEEYQVDLKDCGIINTKQILPNKQGVVWIPAKRHKVILSISDRFNSLRYCLYGYGNNKNEAEIQAQRNAIIYKNKSFDEEPILKQTEKADIENAINVIQELYQKKIIESADYSFDQTHIDANGNPMWHASLSILNYGTSEMFDCSSKKEAKKMVAFYAIQKLRKSIMSSTGLISSIVNRDFIGGDGQKGRLLEIVRDKTGRNITFKALVKMDGQRRKYPMQAGFELFYPEEMRPVIVEFIKPGVGPQKEPIKTHCQGMEVTHDKYGKGKIMRDLNDDQVEIKFDNDLEQVKHYYSIDYVLNNMTMPHYTIESIMTDFDGVISSEIKAEYERYKVAADLLQEIEERYSMDRIRLYEEIDNEIYDLEDVNDIYYGDEEELDFDPYERIDYTPFDETDYNQFDEEKTQLMNELGYNPRSGDYE